MCEKYFNRRHTRAYVDPMDNHGNPLYVRGYLFKETIITRIIRALLFVAILIQGRSLSATCDPADG